MSAYYDKNLRFLQAAFKPEEWSYLETHPKFIEFSRTFMDVEDGYETLAAIGDDLCRQRYMNKFSKR